MRCPKNQRFADLFRQESTSEPVERSADAVTWPDVSGPQTDMQPGNDISDPDGMMAPVGKGAEVMGAVIYIDKYRNRINSLWSSYLKYYIPYFYIHC